MGVKDYHFVTEADTREGGRFLFSGLPVSKYLLVVTAPGMGKVTRTVKAPVQDLVIHLGRAATLEVSARSRAGAPVAETAIHVELPDGTRFWTAKTDAGGRAVFEDLPAGTLLVAAVIEGGGRQLHNRRVPMREVSLATGRRTRMSVEVPERIPVTLTVKDELGSLRQGVVLGFQTRFGGLVRAIGLKEWQRLRSLRVTTDAAGRARVELYAGEYDVMLVEGKPVSIGRLTVTKTASRGTEFVVPRELTVLRGRLREWGTNRPLRNVPLHVSKQGDSWSLSNARTDNDGRFEIKGLPRALIRISVNQSDLLREAYAPVGCRVDLAEKSEVALDLYAPRIRRKGAAPWPHEVTVLVSGAAEAPLVGAHVGVWTKLGDGWALMGNAKTDESGSAVLKVVEASRYRVSAWAKGHASALRVVDRDGERIEVTLTLERTE